MSDTGPLSVSSAASALVERILAYAGEQPVERLEHLRQRLQNALATEPDEAVGRLVERLMTTGSDFAYYPPDPLARKIQHEVAEFAVIDDSKLVGGEFLDTAGDVPLVLLSNHLSYSDANLLEVLLRKAGRDAVAERLTVVVGPKVYSEPFRRFSSLCFGTIKTPQPTAVSSDEAVMPPREVARLARETIAIAVEREAMGDAVLIFIEGTRSRNRAMQRALQGVARYFDEPERLVVPVAICGSERFVPIGVDQINPTRVTIRVGRAARAADLVNRCGLSRQLRMDAVGVAIARLLPPEYRGVYGEGTPEHAAASAIADEIFGAA